MTPEINSAAGKADLAVVDDDALFRESITQNLEEAGFCVSAYRDGREALDKLLDGVRPDILLLDWKMPELNGIEVLRQMREYGIDVPVIFLTVLGDQIYEEAALSGGAVDFVEKARSFSILLRRIELILRRPLVEISEADEETRQGQIERGQMVLKLDSSRIIWKGKQVDLSLSEFKIVRLMVENAGQDLSYRTLYDLVHGEGFIAGEGDVGYRANVRAFIKRIRQKFRDIDGEFDGIENYPGFGYRWVERDAA